MAYGVIMCYHLHMPLYFLGTFTEYPYESISNRFLRWSLSFFISDTRFICQEIKALILLLSGKPASSCPPAVFQEYSAGDDLPYSH